MTVSISADEHQKLQLAAHRIIESKSPSIREVAQIISGCNSPTERISAFADSLLQPIMKEQ